MLVLIIVLKRGKPNTLATDNLKPGLHIVVTIAEHACDHVSKRILKLSRCRSKIILVKYE